jgi:hypothetical protein
MRRLHVVAAAMAMSLCLSGCMWELGSGSISGGPREIAFSRVLPLTSRAEQEGVRGTYRGDGRDAPACPVLSFSDSS